MLEHEKIDIPTTRLPETPAQYSILDELQRSLHADQYEDAKEALSKTEDLLGWRKAKCDSSFPQFYRLFEATTFLNQSSASADIWEETADKLVADARALSPRVSDLYFCLLSDMDQSPYIPQFEMTNNQFESLKQSGDLTLLQNPSIPWEAKLNCMRTQIETELKGRKALDRFDREKARSEFTEQKSDIPELDTLPPDTGEHESMMDEMDRLKEGEKAVELAVYSPGIGKYVRCQSFDSWESKSERWLQSVYNFEKVELPKVDYSSGDQLLRLKLRGGQWTRVPLSDKFDIEGVLENSNSIFLQVDQNGDYRIRPSSDGLISLKLKELEGLKERRGHPESTISIPADFTDETNTKLVKVDKTKSSNVKRARALAAYTMRRLIYSNDSKYNEIYKKHPNGKIGGIDREKFADCDVSADYYAALCVNLNSNGIPARLVTGHFLNNKNEEGNSCITSGTGHAWTEVWDENEKLWVQIDATPPSDPIFEESDQLEGSLPGVDFGREEIGPTDEELEILREKLNKHTEELSYTDQERELSEATGVGLEEARQIIKEIQDAENTRLPDGERVVDVMARMWDLIRDSRKTTTKEYTGPLRKKEGGEEISDTVAHRIGILSGESDPVSRQKEHEHLSIESVLHKMRVIIIGDKSGSMNNTVDGETKWKMQRRGTYLVLSSLHRAEQNMIKSAKSMTDPLSLESEVISFRGGGENDLDTDKPSSNTFTLADKVKLWKSLGNQGSGNGDIAALSYIRDNIKKEREEIELKNKKDDILRVILACSDGMPDSESGVHQLAEELGAMNTVTVGIGMTETAKQVPIIFNTPHSKGDFAKDMSDLPAIIAKHVVLEAVRLFPEKNKKQYEKSIYTLLAKFNRIGIK